MKKPSDFTTQPWSSVLGKSECETIAANIMVILKRTGNNWRKLSYEEYKEERLKDGNFSNKESTFFEMVVGYTESETTARLFSPTWEGI